MRSKSAIEASRLNTRRKNVPAFSFSLKDEDFRVSGYSHPNGIIATCVSVAITNKGVAVRDTKDPLKKTLFFNRAEWRAFVKGVKDQQFDIR